jgi:hypothetical protein
VLEPGIKSFDLKNLMLTSHDQSGNIKGEVSCM